MAIYSIQPVLGYSPNMRATRSGIVLAAWLGLAGPAAAQSQPTLLDSYGRVTSLLDYMTGYVGEALLACAAKGVLGEEQAEARYQAYRKRNAALLERAGAWNQDAEKRLNAQGDERVARRVAEDASLTAMAAASARAHGEIGRASDVRAACAAKIAAIQSGHYDLSSNGEFVNLLKAKP